MLASAHKIVDMIPLENPCFYSVEQSSLTNRKILTTQHPHPVVVLATVRFAWFTTINLVFFRTHYIGHLIFIKGFGGMVEYTVKILSNNDP